MTFTKKGVVIPLGAPGEIDDVRTYAQSVIERNGKTWCYYSAHDGGYWRVALAISDDGLNFIKKGVVIPLGAAGEIDDVFTYTPSVIERDGKIWCYYSAYDGSNVRIALAISDDGLNFTKKGVVIPLGAAGEIDDYFMYALNVIERDGKIWCYYSAHDGSNVRIALAISDDGLNFIKKGVVIPLGAAGEIDDVRTYTSSVIERNGKLWDYYSPYDGSNYRTALAISNDGLNFTKKGVVIPLGATGEIDDSYAYAPCVIERNGSIWSYYSARDGTNTRIALAISDDGF